MRAFALALCACACTTPKNDSKARAPAAEPPPDGDRYEAAMSSIRGRLDSMDVDNMKLRREPPFIVVADGGERALERGTETVRWAVEHLEADFFDARPSNVLPVFLFRSASSYRDGVHKLTGEYPSTPYGFYSRTHAGLFMNIATGGGTLVHEIVHPYVEADFPSAPPWLNEGLGSLFEQSAERDGHIIGLTNWRLAGLQDAIANDRVPTFRSLTHLEDDEFYGDDSGVNYAAARYLLYYLQEHGKLRDLYRSFRDGAATDPSGYQTLSATLLALGEEDMAAFEEKWRSYVAALTYP